MAECGEEIMPYFTTPQICLRCAYDGTEDCTGDPDKCKLDAYEKHCDNEYERKQDLKDESVIS